MRCTVCNNPAVVSQPSPDAGWTDHECASCGARWSTARDGRTYYRPETKRAARKLNRDLSCLPGDLP